MKVITSSIQAICAYMPGYKQPAAAVSLHGDLEGHCMNAGLPSNLAALNNPSNFLAPLVRSSPAKPAFFCASIRKRLRSRIPGKQLGPLLQLAFLEQHLNPNVSNELLPG
jgi:hypothetical protein